MLQGTRQLSRLFHQTAKAAGITELVSLHSLRHSFAAMRRVATRV